MYQGIPIGGYTKLVENLLEGIEVRLNENYLKDKAKWNAMAKKVVYTGAIDAYFDYTLGNLEYRSVRFENEILDMPNFQGNAAVNYTDRETPWTRIIEHKWFEFGKDEMEMTCQRPLSVRNILRSGSRGMSHITRLMIRRTGNFTKSIKRWQRKRKISFLEAA